MGHFVVTVELGPEHWELGMPKEDVVQTAQGETTREVQKGGLVPQQRPVLVLFDLPAPKR